MKKLIAIFFLLLLSSCYFGDNPSSNKKIVKDFWLNWWENKTDKHILLSNVDNGSMGTIIIEATVAEVGFNDDFIIVKQHPNVARKITERLSNYHFDGKAQEIKDLADTIWLHDHDEVYEYNGKYFHKERFAIEFLPDSLRPYKGITNYFILDLRKYDKTFQNYELYKLKNEEEFFKKRKELKVPKSLNFTIKESFNYE